MTEVDIYYVEYKFVFYKGKFEIDSGHVGIQLREDFGIPKKIF